MNVTGCGRLEGAPVPSRVLGSYEEIREERQKEEKTGQAQKGKKDGERGRGLKVVN